VSLTPFVSHLTPFVSQFASPWLTHDRNQLLAHDKRVTAGGNRGQARFLVSEENPGQENPVIGTVFPFFMGKRRVPVSHVRRSPLRWLGALAIEPLL
jgi:hypothetical protein